MQRSASSRGAGSEQDVMATAVCWPRSGSTSGDAVGVRNLYWVSGKWNLAGSSSLTAFSLWGTPSGTQS
jgi:hypothetical protein